MNAPRWIAPLFFAWWLVFCAASSPTAAQETASTPGVDVFKRSNLVAWCIVPFDAKKRTPYERAEMLTRLGLSKVAYDWREEHVPTFEKEILAYRLYGLQFFAFWGEHPEAFRLFQQYDLHPQIWITAPSPEGSSQEEKVAAAAQQLTPLLEKARKLKCPLGLYNHGGWGGEPQNLVAVCERLRKQHQTRDVGIVYNFHHGHDHIADFADCLTAMLPYLLCLNINGMNEGADPKILTLGEGQHEDAMLRTVLQLGYKGPIGIIDHRPEMDAEASLRLNLRGLQRLQESLAAPPPPGE